MGEARQRLVHALDATVQVVAQQLAGGRDRGRRPWRADRGGRVGVKVQQRPEGRHPRHPVGEGVMQLQEQAHTLLWQTRKEPDLPQRPRGIQPSPCQLRAGL